MAGDADTSPALVEGTRFSCESRSTALLGAAAEETPRWMGERERSVSGKNACGLRLMFLELVLVGVGGCSRSDELPPDEEALLLIDTRC